MAKLYFKYGCMGSSKTAQALITKFNYEEKGMKTLLFKPNIDTRDGSDIIKSRIGLNQKAIIINDDTSIKHMFFNSNYHNECDSKIEAIIVDEAQFLSPHHINELRSLVDEYDVTVICFGLRTDFTGHLFDGSKRLMEIADCIEEIKTMCECGKKATMNMRLNEYGKAVRIGAQIEIGGNDKYISVCSKCYNDRF